MEQKLLEPKKEECDMKDETNDIYVYIGTYMYANYVDIEHGPTDIRVARNSNKADYRLYRNLEYDLDEIQVLIANCDEFEKTHKVILLKTCLPKDKFYEVKKEFIKMVSKHEKKKLVNKFLKI